MSARRHFPERKDFFILNAMLFSCRSGFDAPGMNGEKLLPQIKEKQNIPVIVVSAKDSIDSKVEASDPRSRGLSDETI